MGLHANLDGSGKPSPHWIQTPERPARGSRYANYAIPTTTKPGISTPDIYIGHPTLL